MLSLEIIILQLGLLLVAGVLVSTISDRFGVPLLLLFLGVGMIAGSEGIGGIEFSNSNAAQGFGTIALLVILFAGGLDTRWNSVRPVLMPGLLLSTLGVCLTTLILGTFIWLLLGDYSIIQLGTQGLGFAQALLLAAIVSSTDAAAVFSIYRTSSVLPTDKLRSLLEFESGSNDPVAVILTTAILGYLTLPDFDVGSIALILCSQLVVGAGIGLAVGFIGSKLANSLKLSVSGLYPVLILALGITAFGLAEWLGGNGFLAIYVAGVALSNQLKQQLESVRSFHDGLSWMMQISMFVVLGLLVFPSNLLDVAWAGIAIALFLMFIARPLSIFISLAPFSFQPKEKLYLSWVGLRGAVPIVLATFPATYGLEGADSIFSVIFFVVVASVLIQGYTLVPCTRWLGVTKDKQE